MSKDRNIKNNLKEQNNEEYEICISCKEVTDVRKDTPIEFRNLYIIGAGQLCRHCYHELYEQ